MSRLCGSDAGVSPTLVFWEVLTVRKSNLYHVLFGGNAIRAVDDLDIGRVIRIASLLVDR